MSRAAEARRFLLFVVIPASGFLSPLLVIPAVTSRFGQPGWTAIALAQSLGSGIATATEMGWGVVGPQRIASMDRDGRVAQYRLSLTSRSLTVIPGAVVAALGTAFLSHEYSFAAALLAFGLALQGMTPSWFFVGSGQPGAILLTESAPRILIAVASAVAILNGAPLWVYSLLMFLSVPLAQLVARRIIGHGARPTRQDWKAAPSIARNQLVIGGGRAVSVVYTALPTALVGAFAHPSVAVFSASDRLMRMSTQVLQAVPARLQSWIGAVHGDVREARIRKAQQVAVCIGIVSGCGFALLAPLVAHFAFSGTVEIPYTVSIMSGLILAVIQVSTSFGLSLVARHQANLITYAIIPSAVVGALLIGPLAFLAGVIGAQSGQLLAELTGTGLQRRALTRTGQKK